MRVHLMVRHFNLPQCDGVRTGPAQLTMRCPECNSTSLFEVQRKSTQIQGKHMDEANFFQSYIGDIALHVDISAVYPSPQRELAHDAVPTNVQTAFNEALNALQGGSHNLAIVGFRKTVEILVGEGDGPLARRIDGLDVPNALRHWAHAVREFGNSAVHEDFGASRDAANEVMEFTRLLLEYHYVLPARVTALRRSRGRA
jgi:hypothetical protein